MEFSESKWSQDYASSCNPCSADAFRLHNSIQRRTDVSIASHARLRRQWWWGWLLNAKQAPEEVMPMIRSVGIPVAVTIGLGLSLTPALAQDAATVNVAEDAEHGQYLTDAEGRALYLFESDTRAEGDGQAVVSCSGECLDRWPPLYSDDDPQAGDMTDAAILATVEHAGKMMVTYNGWPLYYFVEDQAPGDIKGHDIEEFGAEWYLVSPEGEKVDDH